jgi:threonine dehydrogenase-like Zn-dependent dehydrogenase
MVKAAVFLGPEQLEIREFPRPKVARDCALLKVTNCGVCGTDPHIYSGHLQVPTPTVLGHEFSGILEEMGPDFPRKDMLGNELKEGDPVTLGTSLVCGDCFYCRFTPHRNNLCEKCNIYGITMTCDQPPHLFGGYAEYIYLYPNSWVYKVPEGITLEEAALADPIACATKTFERAFQPGLPSAWESFGIGKSVVIQGLGTIGILSAAAAKAAGAYPVIGIEGIPLRMEMAKKFGVDVIIDLNKFTTPEERVEEVKRLTRGVGPDVVLEMAGVPQAFAESIMLVRPGGKVVEFGHFTDVGTVPINPQHIVNKDLDILGVFAYPNSQIAISLALMESTKDRFPYHELITHRFPVEKAEEALKAGRNKACVKSMIVPGYEG